MKKIFTLMVVLAIAVTGFAQIKSQSHKNIPAVAKQQIYTGLEELSYDGINNFVPVQQRNITAIPEEFEIGQSYYDWQTNAASRNQIAVWPDGYTAACFTQGTDETYSDRGTGIAVFDPEVGEWTMSEGRVENIRTGFGCISRYGERGLCLTAHTANECMIMINETFRDGGAWGEPIYLDNTNLPTWPVIQTSGANLDIIHILVTASGVTINGITEPLIYFRYENGAWTAENVILDPINENHAVVFSSNDAVFLHQDNDTPNRVAAIINSAWCDGKVIYSDDNGATWNEKVYYNHPGYNVSYPAIFMYPRWVTAAFDNDDNLRIAYEFNGSTGDPGSGSYYPGLGGVAYWDETLPLNPDAVTVGFTGPAGEPFVMDTNYLYQDVYASWWYFSDATHPSFNEYMGSLMPLDEQLNVIDPEQATTFIEDLSLHGSYNSGIAGMPTMLYDKETNSTWVFWVGMASGTSDGTNVYYRIFGNASFDGGRTWEGQRNVLNDFMNTVDEMVYPMVSPHVYWENGEPYAWFIYQNDQETGTFVQGDEAVGDNNFYRAVKVNLWETLSAGENTIAETVSMNVYPNPVTSQELNIEVNNASEISIYNAVGQLVKSFNVESAKTINVADFATGVYFIQANSGSAITTQKVVIK